MTFEELAALLPNAEELTGINGLVDPFVGLDKVIVEEAAGIDSACTVTWPSVLELTGQDIDVIHFSSGLSSTLTRQGNRHQYVDAVAGVQIVTLTFGRANDEPVFGQFSGAGQDLPGVRRGNQFFLDNDNNGVADVTFSYGRASDLVQIFDWDQNGTDTIGLMRGTVLLVKNSFTGGAADAQLEIGC